MATVRKLALPAFIATLAGCTASVHAHAKSSMPSDLAPEVEAGDDAEATCGAAGKSGKGDNGEGTSCRMICVPASLLDQATSPRRRESPGTAPPECFPAPPLEASSSKTK